MAFQFCWIKQKNLVKFCSKDLVAHFLFVEQNRILSVDIVIRAKV